MGERITISAPNGTKEEFVSSAHEEGLNLSQYLLSKTKVTYITQICNGLYKIGKSSDPFKRGSKYGILIAIITDPYAENYILNKYERYQVNSYQTQIKTTEIVSVELDVLLEDITSKYNVFLLDKGYNNLSKNDIKWLNVLVDNLSKVKIETKESINFDRVVATPMSEEMFIGLEKLAENMGVNKTDIMRKALELMIQDNPISGVCECCGSEAVLHAVNYTNYDELCDECDTGASCIQCGEMIDPEDGQEMCFECYSDSMPD